VRAPIHRTRHRREIVVDHRGLVVCFGYRVLVDLGFDFDLGVVLGVDLGFAPGVVPGFDLAFDPGFGCCSHLFRNKNRKSKMHMQKRKKIKKCTFQYKSMIIYCDHL